MNAVLKSTLALAALAFVAQAPAHASPGDPHFAPTQFLVAANDAYGRRDGERLYEADVTSVRAIVGTPAQRCWIEHEQVSHERGSANVPAGIAGALIGGIIGHQIGGGTGNSIATAGGAVAGAAIGANAGRAEGGTTTKDVQHCANAQGPAKPEYWDVNYTFRGVQHRAQLSAPPGRSITVNEQGEPRQ